MPREVNEKALDAVSNFIHEVQGKAMVQGFVLIVETIDEEDKWISVFISPDQRRWETFGYLEYTSRLVDFGMSLDDEEDSKDDPM